MYLLINRRVAINVAINDCQIHLNDHAFAAKNAKLVNLETGAPLRPKREINLNLHCAFPPVTTTINGDGTL